MHPGRLWAFLTRMSGASAAIACVNSPKTSRYAHYVNATRLRTPERDERSEFSGQLLGNQFQPPRQGPHCPAPRLIRGVVFVQKLRRCLGQNGRSIRAPAVLVRRCPLRPQVARAGSVARAAAPRDPDVLGFGGDDAQRLRVVRPRRCCDAIVSQRNTINGVDQRAAADRREAEAERVFGY